MIQLSHHYRIFPAFFTPERQLFIDRPTEDQNAPTTLERDKALERLKTDIAEAFRDLEQQKALKLIECIIDSVRPKIARFREIWGDKNLERGDLSEIATLVLTKVEAHLDARTKRMASVKLTTPDTGYRNGGMSQIRNAAHSVMKHGMTGCTLTDEEMQALDNLGNYIRDTQRMENVVLEKKTELLSCQIEILVDVLQEWFKNGVLRFEIPALGFFMNNPDTLTLENYLEVNRTLDDAKILKNFSIALRNLHRRLSLLITYYDDYKDQKFYQDMMKDLQPLKDKILGLLEEYNQFLGNFGAKERAVRGINPFDEAL